MTPTPETQTAAEQRSPQLPSVSPPRNIRVALAGCGVVGGGLVRLLHESSAAIAARYGVSFTLTSVLVRNPDRDRQLPLDPQLFTSDVESFLAGDAEVIIEALGGHEPARTIAAAALKRGKKLITANKEVVASYGDGLAALADNNETGFDFGAAVGGSAPVISTLRDLVGAHTPRSVRGILNGTSNYVISLLEEGASLDDALASARARGLAESDCSRDLDGQDAAAKLAIVAWIAFGVRPQALSVRRIPLTPGLAELVRFAAALGGRLRFIAECVQLPGNELAASIEPVVVPFDSSFARTTREDNRVEVDLGWGSPLSISGPGAGSRPTATALLSDLIRFTPPPNVRGSTGTEYVSVPDPRRHQWLLGCRSDLSLAAVADGAGIPVAHERCGDAEQLIVTAPIAWAAARNLISALDARGTVVRVARCELVQPGIVQ